MTKPTIYSTFPIPVRRRAGEAADVNADFMTTGTLLNTPTLYPSAYLVLTSKGYTNVTEVESRASSLALPRCSNVTERKHYYAGADLCASREQSQACLSYAETKQSVRSNRVAASLGGGGLKATGSNSEMQERADWLFWESHDRVNGRMLQENDHECIWQSSLPTGEYCKPIDGIPGRMNASVEFYLNDLYYNLMMLAEEQHQEKEVYFYHSDHLGSASWITDGSGIPVQHLQYLPFGEPFVDQHPAGYQERFRFTGKERDEETGYGYFGARYMDHELTAMWLSVDPMADKYPSISPYAYCAWNPIKLVDPDGREFDPASQKIIDAFKEKTNQLKKSMDCKPEERKEYDAALKEIAQLEKPGQMYHVKDVGFSYNREKGGTFYQPEDNSICIEFDGRIGNLAHELKHAYQYEMGELSFSKDGREFGELYDVTDEKAALRRGGAYDKQQNETLKNVENVYRFAVKNNPDIDWYYPFREKRPDKHSMVGHRSSSRTVQNAQSLGISLSNDYYKKP